MRVSRCLWIVPWVGEGVCVLLVCVSPSHTGAQRGPPHHSGPVTSAMCAEVHILEKTGILNKFWKTLRAQFSA